MKKSVKECSCCTYWTELNSKQSTVKCRLVQFTWAIVMSVRLTLHFVDLADSNSLVLTHFWVFLLSYVYNIITTLLFQPLSGSLNLVWNNQGDLVPEETFTHSHLSWSSIIPICFLHLLRSMASSLFKFSLVYLLAWHHSLHTLYISSPNYCLCSTCPYHHNMFCCNKIMSYNPSLSVNP